MAFTLNQADLEFVLKQIKIAEANANGIPLTKILLDAQGEVITDPNAVDANNQRYYAAGTFEPLNPLQPRAVPDAQTPFGLRTVDGTYNNLVPGQETWGAAGQPMPRLFDDFGYLNETDNDVIGFGGGVTASQGNYTPGTPAGPMLTTGSVVDADPRTISNLIVDMSVDNPAALVAALTFAGSEDPMSDIAALMAARVTQTQANDALAAAQDVVDGANSDLADAIAAYTSLLASAPDQDQLTDAIDTIQTRAAALSDAEAALEEATVVAANPLAAFKAKAAELGLEFDQTGSLIIPNVAPDEGLSAPFNSWMTFFGQFFDHGLDLISKGDAGKIYIPLQPDDPLYRPGSPTNFMVVTRSTTFTNEDGQETQRNVTTPWVDQNQTYTSHASHQVFLREYTLVDGKPVATGKLLDGTVNGQKNGLPTWADIKAQALMLGIELTDLDVNSVPLLRTDAYGNFIPDANGFAQVITDIGPDGIPNTADDSVVSKTTNGGLPVNSWLVGAARTANAFLDDIAHNAAPVAVGGVLQADGDTVVGYSGGVDARGTPTAYDNELLDKHFITGDGRGNENIGLTAVHHVFHSEHNRQVDSHKLTILRSGDLTFVNEWLTANIDAATLAAFNAGYDAASNKGAYLAASNLFNGNAWDGERLFQSGRFATEMQYQHLVFEEFGRKIQPAIDPFVFNSVTDINPAIFAEFANVVYRFGHSMLTDTMPRIFIDANGQISGTDDKGLIASFLNPLAFNQNQLGGTISAEQAAGAIVRGMTIERGNEIDEFVTGALRNTLLGLPLDLAAINIARGRDTGMPTLNEARQQLFAASGSSFLTPYTSWVEFAANLKNPMSVVNFIAAYGTHGTITDKVLVLPAADPPVMREKTVEEKRDAAMAIVFGVATGTASAVPADRLAFLNSTGAYNAQNSGLNSIDLWIGGLAEKKMPFGGFLGSTFNAVFEAQMEALQDGDRFYYLTRTQGQNFLTELEQNSFAKMIMANTDISQPGADGIRGTDDDVVTRHIGVDSFAAYDYVLEVNAANQEDYNGDAAGVDPLGNDPVLEALGLGKVIRNDPGTAGPDANYLRTFGGEHVVVGGTSGNDTIITDFGDDGIWGDAGNDRIESGAGVDLVNGGAGDDIITDSGDSGDFLKGDAGNDVIANSNGLDILMGGTGNDVVFVGVDDTEVFAGEGNDFVAGGDGVDMLIGGEGDDWLEGGGGFDTTAGDNSELFFNSTIIGHDVMFAGSEEHDFDAESGDDIMVQGPSVMRSEGMFGFDWAIHKGNTENADSDLTKPIFTTDAADILRDRFDAVEALSGWERNDVLRGDDRGVDSLGGGVGPVLAGAEGTMVNHELTHGGVDRIAGLRSVIGNVIQAPTANAFEDGVAFARGNILLGGGGSDLIEGRGGDDIIDGDAWLNVRISIRVDDPESNSGTSPLATVDSLRHIFSAADLDPDAPAGSVIPAAWIGKSLSELMISRTIAPLQLNIVREIVEDPGVGDVDVAVFNDSYLGANGTPNYTIAHNDDGTVTVAHVNVTIGVDPDTGRQIVSDGVDTLRNVEFAQFADGTRIKLYSDPPTDIRWDGVVPAISALPGNGTIAQLATIDADSTSWTYSLRPGSDAGFTVSATGQVQRTGGAMIANSTYTLIIRSTDAENAFREETFVIRTGSDGIDTITVANANDHIIYGDDNTDTLTGGAGNDTLFGQDEDDTLQGGLGDDVLNGGIGDSDTASYGAASGPVTVNLTTGLATGAAGNDTLFEIENITGSGFDDVLTGNGATNRLAGGAGADALNGAGGNDTLLGDAGNDTLTGGTGNDSLQGGADNDAYVFGLADGDDTISDSSGADSIRISTGGASLSNLSFQRLTATIGGTSDDLAIVVGASTVDVLSHYAATAESATPGAGAIETLAFEGGASFAGYAVGSGPYNLNASRALTLNGTGQNDILAAATQGGAFTTVLNGGDGADLLFGAGGNDTLNGGNGDDLLVGGAGTDTMSGGAGNDTIVYDIDNGGANESISGGADTDTLVIVDGGGNTGETLSVLYNGTRLTAAEAIAALNVDIERVTADLGGGTDSVVYTSAAAVTVDLAAGTASGFASVANIENVTGGTGNDTFTGNAASNTFNGGTGTDRAVYAGTADDYRYALTGGNLQVIGDVTGTDTLISVEQVQFGATVYSAAAGNLVLGTDVSNNPLNGGANGELILGFDGTDVINGNAGADIIFGGEGNDTINAGDQDDAIVWGVGDGRDFVNGGAGTDTNVINGDASNETFRVYTRDAWDLVTGNNIASLNGATQIVITRGGTGVGSIIAELTGIEEIVVNTGDGNDQVLAIGDFSPTNLSPNTITVNGGTGNDTVDINGLLSAHRILFRSNGGNDTIVGNLRPQDVIELVPGADISTYDLVDNGNGTQTFSNGVHSITFTGAVPPEFVEGSQPGGNLGSGAFTLTASDLAGLKAIVAGGPTGDGEFEAVLGVRELSGFGNNEGDPTRGSADVPFIRLTEARYGEFDPTIGNNKINPIFDGLDARAISNILGSQEVDLPKAANESNIFFMAFGQYFDHGLDFLPKSAANGIIEIGGPGSGRAPGTDNPADLTRGAVHEIDENGVPQHLNLTSPYVDQNQAYGSNGLVGQFLRETDGQGGVGARLLSGAPDPSSPGFNLLPTLRELIEHHWANDTSFTGLPGGPTTFRTYFAGLVNESGVINQAMVPGLASNFMGSGHALLLDANPYINLLDHFVAGDGRANENISLTAIHTVWARNHNFHVENLLNAGFEGTPEEVFQAAKVINEAEYARVVFTEFADKLLGGIQGNGSHGFEAYNPDATAGISHEFAAAVYRFGHSLISDTLTVIGPDGQPRQVALYDAFLNPTNADAAFTLPVAQLNQFGYFPQPGFAQVGVSGVVAGTIGQQAEEADFNIVNAVRSDLVRINADLFAFNVARGRDVGLGTLNQVRADLRDSTDPYIREALSYAGNLDPYGSWEDFQQRNGLSDAIIAQFKQAYPDLVLAPEEIAAFQAVNPDIELVNGNTVKGIDRVDLWVGGLAEKHIMDGMVGQTFWIVLHEQFDRLQEADRFYYIDRLDNFDLYENIIDGQSFADIIARNTGLTGLPERVFEISDEDDGTGVGTGEDEDDEDDDGVGTGGGDDEDDDDTTGETGGEDEDDEDEDDSEDDEDCGCDEDGDGEGTGTPVPPPAGGTGALRTGTLLADVLVGTAAADNLVALAGDDVLVGEGGDDALSAGEGQDFADAGDGRDVIFAGAGDDQVFAGGGNDMVYGEAGADRLFGGAGNDLIDAGSGDDTVVAGAGDDLILGAKNDGDDSYFGDEMDGGTGVDTLDLSAITANLTVDLGNGLGGRGSAMSSQSGTDTLWSIENVATGSGNDTITASAAVNVMEGGAGTDTFRFLSKEAADGDTILDFEPGDKLDLGGIDANAGVAGNQSFTLLASGQAFSTAAQLSVTYETRADGDYTVVSGNVDATPDAEFQINLKGSHALTGANFSL